MQYKHLLKTTTCCVSVCTMYHAHSITQVVRFLQVMFMSGYQNSSGNNAKMMSSFPFGCCCLQESCRAPTHELQKKCPGCQGLIHSNLHLSTQIDSIRLVCTYMVCSCVLKVLHVRVTLVHFVAQHWLP